MKRLLFPLVLLVLALPAEGLAQTSVPSGPIGVTAEPTEDLRTRNALSQSELKRLSEQLEQWNRVEGNGVTPRVARSRTAAMLAALKVPCGVTDAAYRGTAPEDAQRHIYEAACDDGMGYLLILQKSNLQGLSCLSRAQDAASVKCALPANADEKTMAGAVLRHHQIACNVQDVKWLGANTANLEHVAVACDGGNGYVVRSPQPGTSGTLEVLSCDDAGKQGITCDPSVKAASAPASGEGSRPTLAWFKDALSANGVACQTKRARIIGRESIKRRYLVEFECADRPEGLVAYVPPPGDTANAFASMSCATAAERGIRCELLSREDSPPAR